MAGALPALPGDWNECEIGADIDIFAPATATTTDEPARATATYTGGEDCEDEDWEPIDGPSPFDADWPKEDMPSFS